VDIKERHGGIIHPPPYRLLTAVVRPQISPSPAARSAATALLNFTHTLIGTKLFDRQRCLVMTGPIAFTLAVVIDQ